jgi:hypothetical protein
MAARVPARLSPEEGRRFGLLVGAAFVALAALAAWRGHPLSARGFAALGAALIAAGVLVPARLGTVHRLWMQLAGAVSKVTTPVVLGVVYFAAVTPTGVLRRLFGGDRLVRSRAATTFWVTRPPRAAGVESMRRQF